MPTVALAVDFDRDVAPILAKHCLECHNGSDRKGKLDLSAAKPAMAGGESGVVIEPGDPGKSFLWEYVRDDAMPPKKRTKLTGAEKKLLRDWIAEGAKWGTSPIDPFRFSSEKRAGYDWWSVQPIASPKLPAVKDERWAGNAIDRFVLARLEAKDLAPAPPAERRVLIRRLSFDLIGLPPTPAEVEAFVNDQSPDAYEKLVDRLLASPHFGERWARHWLDVVRYGESQGFERNVYRPNAWRYRDWVIDAFNDDMPYDKFVRWQLAGDVLEPANEDAIIATGFLVCGTWDQVGHLEGSADMKKAARQDHLEDVVGTLGQTLLGLTLHCARCHDHKFDPITQAEYYRVASAVSGVNQAQDERDSIFDKKVAAARRQAIEKKLEPLRNELAAIEAEGRKLAPQVKREAPPRVEDGLEALYVLNNIDGEQVADVSQRGQRVDLKIADRKAVAPNNGGGLEIKDKTVIASPSPPKELIAALKKSQAVTIEAWVQPADAKQSGPARIFTLSASSGERNFTLGQDGDKYEVRFRTTKTNGNGLPGTTSPGGSIASQPQKPQHVVFTRETNGQTRLYIDGELRGSAKAEGDLGNWSDDYRLAIGNELSGDRPWRGVIHLAALYSRALSAEQVAANHRAGIEGLTVGPPVEELIKRLPEPQRQKHAALRREIDALQQQLALAAGGEAHVPYFRQPDPTRVLDRGEFKQPRDTVAPGAIAALRGVSPDFGLPPDAPEAQRRVRLAEWITDPANPLAARVIVNRLWHYHFGRGLVATPSDFGFNGGEPSHPQLLDYLARQLIENDWRLKHVHRLIVTSATYRQSSIVDNPSAEQIDGDNALLWRQNPRRLEAEAVRDAVLLIAGQLNTQMGGPSYKDFKHDIDGSNHGFEPIDAYNREVNRRTIYRAWVRASHQPMLEPLDCPDPTVTTPARAVTTTPLQALTLLNNTFMRRSAEHTAKRVRDAAGDDMTKQIDRAYTLILGRSPDAKEREVATAFINNHGLEQFALVLFNTNEFLYVD